jgi:5-methylcytosine-specific restriction protein A
MAAYLLTWNPTKWNWGSIEDCILELNEMGKFIRRWSCGNTKKIQVGDRIYIIRLGLEPRGIFASGRASSSCYVDAHWNKSLAANGKTAIYIDVDFDILLNPNKEHILSRQQLDAGIFSTVHWSSMSSGISIPYDVQAELENLWLVFLRNQGRNLISTHLDMAIPEEIMNAQDYFEGAVKQIHVNKYERNANVRKKCILHYGAICTACGFNFETVYGEIGKGFIQIHHLVPLYTIQKKYKIDPINDLRPVCANCHAIIHKHNPELKIEQLIELIHTSKTS